MTYFDGKLFEFLECYLSQDEFLKLITCKKQWRHLAIDQKKYAEQKLLTIENLKKKLASSLRDEEEKENIRLFLLLLENNLLEDQRGRFVAFYKGEIYSQSFEFEEEVVREKNLLNIPASIYRIPSSSPFTIYAFSLAHPHYPEISCRTKFFLNLHPEKSKRIQKQDIVADYVLDTGASDTTCSIIIDESRFELKSLRDNN